MATPTRVRYAALTGFVGLAQSLGLDPGRLMNSVGLDVAGLSTPDVWVSAADVARLLDLSARESGCEDFALRLAELRRLSSLGPLSLVLPEEPNLRSVLTLLAKYQRSYNEALRMQNSVSGELATVRTEPSSTSILNR